MIGFKESPIKIVLGLFFVSIIFIILLYVDSVINKPVPIEEISITKDFNKSLPKVKNTLFHEVKKPQKFLAKNLEENQVKKR